MMSNTADFNTRNIQSNKKPIKTSHSSPFKVSTNDLYETASNMPTSANKKATRYLNHSRSYSHDQLSPTHTHQSSTSSANQPNWTALIPPMPSYPQSTYKTDKDEFNFESNKHQQEYQDQQPFKPNQRHSIAVSPSSSKSYENNQNIDRIYFAYPYASVSQKPPLAPTEEVPPAAQILPNRQKSQSRKKSLVKKKKVCKSCGLEITGQFVRALHSAFHVDCFCCNECGKQCSAKFFPYEITDDSTALKYQVALCEYDYFKKLDLICFSCNNALRGPYITALGNKYHLEHFKCAVCQKVFESDESYYEHESSIYCHYHYSKLYASHCEGCHSSIVKQFVELFRGGRNQQWHPECYMVHKFWNVCITADSVGLEKLFNVSASTLDLRNLKVSNIEPNLLLSIEQQIENTVMNCWLTLSGYEETSAACISDMLLNACTGNQSTGLIATGKLILNVEVLFNAIDYVQHLCQSSADLIQQPDESNSSIDQEYFQPLRKEPRNISGKIMSYLAILRKSNQIATSGSLSAELLSVITGCAHYLKLLIRIGLDNALKLNRLKGTTDATDKFLAKTKLYEEFNKNGDGLIANADIINNRLSIPANATDACQSCSKSIEKSCAKIGKKRWHLKCFNCSKCSNNIPDEDITKALFNSLHSLILCKNCSSNDQDSKVGFEVVTDLSQLVYLLKIALFRSKSVMSIEGGMPKRLNTSSQRKSITTIDEEQRSATENNYSRTLTDVTRLRTKRQSQKLSNSIKQNARKSVILEAPEADKAREDVINNDGSVEDLDQSFDGSNNSYSNNNKTNKSNRKTSTSSHLSFINQPENEQFSVKKSLKIRDEPQREMINSHLDRTSDLLKNEKSLTLDDIPRIVAAEQARDQRPNAFKHHNSLYQRQKPMKPMKSINFTSGGSNNSPCVNSANTLNDISDSSNANNVPKKAKYYSELTKSEHFILRHIAVEALLPILGNKYNKEDLLCLIQTKKQSTFWDKFKFGSNDLKKDKHSPVFGVDLQDLTKKYGVDSDLGVGPSKLRIPIVIDDIINALRQKDMSVEGIFRLNGNIKKLRELTDQINKSPLKSPDFSNQTAVQLAALMKKWLRELPNPLLTFNLYDLWISSQKEKNLAVRKRILQLTYCMLPRSHRNLVEVLLYFFSWVASFAEIDEETGSKMDIHNLATVISPNILFSKQMSASEQAPQSGDTYFLAIEVVNQLIEIHEELSIIPEDLLKFFEKCGFSDIKTDILFTKEIMNKFEKVSKENPNFFQNFSTMDISEFPSNQEVRSNTVSRGHSKVLIESHGETSNV